MNPAMSDFRREICREAGCRFLDQVDYSDPCASCPAGHFGRYRAKGCGESVGYKIERRGISIPRIAAEPWPILLLPLKLAAKEGDRGAGDIIARVIGPIGGEAFKTWYRRLFGKDCGCGRRQEVLNALWPL